MDLWLTQTELQNRHEMDELDDELKLTSEWVPRGESHACRQLATHLLRVTPEDFLPERMCGCQPGYVGHGTKCRPCEENSFNTETWMEFTCFSLYVYVF